MSFFDAVGPTLEGLAVGFNAGFNQGPRSLGYSGFLPNPNQQQGYALVYPQDPYPGAFFDPTIQAYNPQPYQYQTQYTDPADNSRNALGLAIIAVFALVIFQTVGKK
jgi:hypothetical protein